MSSNISTNGESHTYFIKLFVSNISSNVKSQSYFYGNNLQQYYYLYNHEEVEWSILHCHLHGYNSSSIRNLFNTRLFQMCTYYSTTLTRTSLPRWCWSTGQLIRITKPYSSCVSEDKVLIYHILIIHSFRLGDNRANDRLYQCQALLFLFIFISVNSTIHRL